VSLPVCRGRVRKRSLPRSLSGLVGSVRFASSRQLLTPPRAPRVLWGLSRPSVLRPNVPLRGPRLLVPEHGVQAATVGAACVRASVVVERVESGASLRVVLVLVVAGEAAVGVKATLGVRPRRAPAPEASTHGVGAGGSQPSSTPSSASSSMPSSEPVCSMASSWAPYPPNWAWMSFRTAASCLRVGSDAASKASASRAPAVAAGDWGVAFAAGVLPMCARSRGKTRPERRADAGDASFY
jgi:hypothetical protein